MNTAGDVPDHDSPWRRPTGDAPVEPRPPAPPARWRPAPPPTPAERAYWGSPDAGGLPMPTTQPAPAGQPELRLPGYTGPPPSTPPPAYWRPQVFIEPPAPRVLPAQDHASLDSEEQSARTLTYGIGMVVGAILLVAICALCSRLVI